MWNKNGKILQAAAPFLEEGLLLLHSNLKVEILTDAAREFLKVPKDFKDIFIYDLPKNDLILEIVRMVEEGIESGNALHLENTISIKICDVDSSNKLIVLKDDTGQEKMLNMGKEFVGNASHELRTPITIIKGFTELLIDTEDLEPAIRKSILQKMEASCNRMEHLVNHLLRLTDLENSNTDTFADVDIHSLVEDISYQVISIYPEVRIEHLRTEEEAKGFVDSDLIELVLTNLFKNAVKYSREEKVIVVKVDVLEDEIYIQIQDKGIGIPEKDLVKIFDRFYTVNKAHCRKLGGAGLGLSIVKLIVNKHKGRIYATSQEGESTTMHLYLPRATSPVLQGALL